MLSIIISPVELSICWIYVLLHAKFIFLEIFGVELKEKHT